MSGPMPIIGMWRQADTLKCEGCKKANVPVQFRGERSEAFGDTDGSTLCKECWDAIEAEAKCDKCEGNKYDPATHTFGGWDHDNDEPITVCNKKEGILKAFGL